MKKYSKYGSLVITIMYLVGIVGFYVNPSYFQGLTEVHLWVVNLTLLLPLFFNVKDIFGLLLVVFLGFSIEVVGVKTGLVFGNYHYGTVLGQLFFGVPIVIGVNWAVLLFAAYSLLSSWIKNRAIASLLIAGVVAALDFLIEPVAIIQQYWHWPSGVVPYQNYIAWFVLSFIFVQVYYCFRVKPAAKVLAGTYLGAQAVFFIYLQFLL